jgi:hypothetical protein
MQDRSGLGAESTKYTTGDHVARGDGKSGYGRKGGQPWTERWLKFDNSYFRCGVRRSSTACAGFGSWLGAGAIMPAYSGRELASSGAP